VTFELGRALLLSGAIAPEALARALGVTLDPGMPLTRALVGLGLLSEETLEAHLRASDPNPALDEVHPRMDLLALLPPGLCNRMAALPVDVDEAGTVHIAVIDPRDQHAASELAYHLRRPVRLVRAPYAALREALVSYATRVPSIVPPPGGRAGRRRPVSHTPAWGTPVHVDPAAPESRSERPFSSIPAQPPAVVASVTTSTRRFFAGMHSAPSEPPPGPPPAAGAAHGEATRGEEPVFELRRGPNMTLTDIEPPTTRMREAPAFPIVGALPAALPSIIPEPRTPHFPDPASTLGPLRAATERDEVLGLIEKSARAVARRVALFVVRKDALVGWSCSPELGDVDALRALSISTRTPSLLATVLAGGVYLGPLLGSVGTALLQVMRTASRDVAIVAVRVADRAAVVVVCDELGDTLLATRHLDIMARVAGEALERVVRARRG